MAENDLEKLHTCTCKECKRYPNSKVAKLHLSINRVLATLDEKSRRRFVGLLAMQHGYGGVQHFARITGLSRTTILRGQREIARADTETKGRLRGTGGGRRLAEKKNPN